MEKYSYRGGFSVRYGRYTYGFFFHKNELCQILKTANFDTNVRDEQERDVSIEAYELADNAITGYNAKNCLYKAMTLALIESIDKVA